jgi:prepilin-type N-terminal cleavage/methylation domain-containing protein
MIFIADQRGFTLIELIVVIVVLGILGATGTFGLIQIMDGYTLAQRMSTSTQKAQIALDRITIELSHTIYDSSGSRYNISAGTGDSITYTANFGGADETSTISLSGTQVLLNNIPLTDGIAGLQFSYLDGDGTTVVTATSTAMRLIGIVLTVQVTPTVTRAYNARVTLQK